VFLSILRLVYVYWLLGENLWDFDRGQRPKGRAKTVEKPETTGRGFWKAETSAQKK
jgi:hypothetical protein